MTYVLDASAALEIAFNGPKAAKYMEVLHEAARLNISCYDMFYFVLARHNAATLITCDQKLKTLAIDNGILVE